MKALIIRMERSYRRGFAQGFARAETGEMNLEDVKAWHLRGINQGLTVEEDPLTGRIHQEEIPTVLGRFAELLYREGYLQGSEAFERKAMNKTEVRHFRERGAQRNWLVMEDPFTGERLDPKIIIEKSYKLLRQSKMKNLTAEELRQALREPQQFFEQENFSETEKRGLTAEVGVVRSKNFKGIAYRKGPNGKINLVETR